LNLAATTSTVRTIAARTRLFFVWGVDGEIPTSCVLTLAVPRIDVFNLDSTIHYLKNTPISVVVRSEWRHSIFDK
jgi:hypothetical protein